MKLQIQNQCQLRLEVLVDPEFRSQNSGFGSQESGVRSQESGVRTQESRRLGGALAEPNKANSCWVPLRFTQPTSLRLTDH